MNIFLNNWLRGRMMSAPRGGGGDDVVIPSVYQRVEYLESTANGRQYINTNIVPTATSGMKVKCASNSSNDFYIAGQRNDTSNTRWILGCDDHYYFGWGVWNSGTTFHTGYQNTVELELNYKNSGVASCDDEVIPLSPLTFQPRYPIFVFGSNTGSSLYLAWAGKIYDFQITEGSNVVMHLVPCYRKSDGKPGMWDVVGWKFYENAGSGADFTVGPDVVQPATKYIVFEDRAVEAICVANWSSDGIGLTMQDAAAVTSIGEVFKGNTQITSFNELQYFTYPTPYLLYYECFSGCSSLASVTLPEGVSFKYGYPFKNCPSLSALAIAGDNVAIKDAADIFEGCTSLKHIYANNIPQIVSLVGSTLFSYGNMPFRISGGGHIYINGSEVFNVVIPSTMNVIPQAAFLYCTAITSVELPSTVTEIKFWAFANCASLATVICRATTPPSMPDGGEFTGNASGRKIYVPYGTGATYKAASGWSTYANDIYELNPDGTIPT